MKNSIGTILNPYLPEYEYIPDGEPHVFGDRVYIYGSHDRFFGNVFCQNDYICYSAPVTDLSDWRYEGVIYSPLQDPRTTMGGHQFWAPDVVRGKDGRYYLYYCPDDTIISIGVAVCDTPAGRYEFYGLVQDQEGGIIGERPGDTYCFDPGVFLDDDGSVYLFSGNGPRNMEMVGKEPKASKVMQLADDMLTVVDGPNLLLPLFNESKGTGFEGHEFFEASSIRKFNGKYYLVYSSVTMHELCYAVSDKPDRDYRYGGVLVSNADIFPGEEDQTPKNCFGNNHGGIELINGQYYIFYHRQTNRTCFSRQGCAEPIAILEDGTIPQVELTSQGLNAGPLPANAVYPAACVTHLMGVKTPVESGMKEMGLEHPYLTQDAADFDAGLLGTRPFLQTPRQYIANCAQGLRAMYRYFDLNGTYEMKIRVHGTAKGNVLICNQEDGEILGRIAIEPSASSELNTSPDRGFACFTLPEKNWDCFSGSVCFPEGVQEIHFGFEGEGTFDFLEFELSR